MDFSIRFSDLKVGQRVKVKGTPNENGGFAAQQISMRPSKYPVEMEGAIQELNAKDKGMRMLNRDFALPSSISVKDMYRNNIDVGDLKSGDLVKMKGDYSESNGFTPKKIKIKIPIGNETDELQGMIERIDKGTKTLDVAGFNIAVKDDTEIEGSGLGKWISSRGRGLFS